MAINKGKLHESDIQGTLIDYTSSLLSYLSKFGIETSSNEFKYNLILDDKRIAYKHDIDTSNGRYFFKEYEKYYIPHADSPGVYLFFDNAGEAVYVGKSDNEIGNAAWRHIKPILEFKEAEYMISIPFEGFPFIAASYEYFLLSKYEFNNNIQHN